MLFMLVCGPRYYKGRYAFHFGALHTILTCAVKAILHRIICKTGDEINPLLTKNLSRYAKRKN